MLSTGEWRAVHWCGGEEKVEWKLESSKDSGQASLTQQLCY
jgi:hypothetical protein